VDGSLPDSPSGQPALLAGPPESGQRSKTSTVPSPSLSGGDSGSSVARGQPRLLAGPATVGQSSFLSATPSLSPSGGGGRRWAKLDGTIIIKSRKLSRTGINLRIDKSPSWIYLSFSL